MKILFNMMSIVRRTPSWRAGGVFELEERKNARRAWPSSILLRAIARLCGPRSFWMAASPARLLVLTASSSYRISYKNCRIYSFRMKSWDFIKTKSADCTTVHEHLECIRKPKSSFGFGILWQISLCFLSLPILSCHADVKKGIHLIYTGKSQEGLAELEKSVEAGDEQALFYSALVHLFGSAPTPQKGLPLLEKAVHKGYGPALDTYAGLYLHGHFVPQDSRKALIYYEISAQRGYGPSQFNCGILYKNGEKIPKDLEKAFYYLTLAALNREDLDEISEDAAQYRNEVVASMTKEQYQRALSRFARKHKKPKGKAR